MDNKHQIGTVISGEQLSEFQNTNLTAVGVTRGTEKPLLVLRSDGNSIYLSDAQGQPIEFLVVGEAHTMSIDEANQKFQQNWSKRQPASSQRSASAGRG